MSNQTLERLGGTLLLELPTKTFLLGAIMAALFRDNLDEGFAIRDSAMDLLRLPRDETAASLHYAKGFSSALGP